MSGYLHETPFRHYHRQEDGSVYFVLNDEITSAPDCTGSDRVRVCKFDVNGSAIAVSDWETPAEFEPFRREIETALGLPITLTVLEKVRDAINDRNCEWKAAYDYPGFLGVYPRHTTSAHDDGVCWSFGIDQGVWHGNDRSGDNSVSLTADAADPHNLAPLREDAHVDLVAFRVITHMRHYALKRVAWLAEFAEECVEHIEKTSATSPDTVGPWAVIKGWDAYKGAQTLVNTWRQR